MTNDRAIALLGSLKESLDSYCELNEEGKTAFSMAISALELFGVSEQLPSVQPKVIRCKDCKHRYEIECPMRHIEWVEYEEDEYFETDEVVHDRTLDDGFCDRGEEDDDKE